MKLRVGKKEVGEIEDTKLKLPPIKRTSLVDNLVKMIEDTYLHEKDIIRLTRALAYRAHTGVCYRCRADKPKKGGWSVFICKECYRRGNDSY